MHLNKKIPSNKNKLVTPDLTTIKVLELLCGKGGKYAGWGLNDDHQEFTGELSLTPVVNNFGINIAFKATAEDGSIISEEHTLIALDSENRLTMWTLNSNFNTTVIFDFKFHKHVRTSKDIIVFGYGKSEENEQTREEISFEFFDNGDLIYTYFWGMPNGDFIKQSSANLKKLN